MVVRDFLFDGLNIERCKRLRKTFIGLIFSVDVLFSGVWYATALWSNRFPRKFSWKMIRRWSSISFPCRARGLCRIEYVFREHWNSFLDDLFVIFFPIVSAYSFDSAYSSFSTPNHVGPSRSSTIGYRTTTSFDNSSRASHDYTGPLNQRHWFSGQQGFGSRRCNRRP